MSSRVTQNRRGRDFRRFFTVQSDRLPSNAFRRRQVLSELVECGTDRLEPIWRASGNLCKEHLSLIQEMRVDLVSQLQHQGYEAQISRFQVFDLLNGGVEPNVVFQGTLDQKALL
jgi:hypothetical protein